MAPGAALISTHSCVSVRHPQWPSSKACSNNNRQRRRNEPKTRHQTSRLTPPAHCGTVSRLPSLYRNCEWPGQLAHICVLLSRHNHDLDEATANEISADAGPNGWIVRIDPSIPDGIVRLKEPDVGKPDLRAKKFGFVGTRHRKRFVDAFEDLLRLSRHIAHRVRCDATDVDGFTMNDNSTDDRQLFAPRREFVSMDFHCCT